MRRGEIWWADLGAPQGSEPGHTRPLLIVQADGFNRSRIRTVIGVVLTTNSVLAEMPGNVLIGAAASGLPEDSVANATQLVTVDKAFLRDRVGTVAVNAMQAIDEGLQLVLAL